MDSLSCIYNDIYKQNAVGLKKLVGLPDFDEDFFLDKSIVSIEGIWAEAGSGVSRNSISGLEMGDLGQPSDFEEDHKLGGEAFLESILRIFFACEVERRILPELKKAQERKLADRFYRLGESFRTLGLYRFSSHCYQAAADSFSEIGEYLKSDSSLYELGRNKLFTDRGLAYLKDAFFFFSAGFGYRPYRLLMSSFMAVMGFALYYYYYLRLSFFGAVLFSAMNYLAAVGYIDIGAYPDNIKSVIIAQAFMSMVLNATLFALLVRKWFRV